MPVVRRIRRILVALKDPAAKALPALAKATQLARALDAELVLFQALATPLYLEADIARLGGVTGTERSTRNAALARLETRARRLRSLGIRVSVSAEWDYPAYEAVIRAAGRAAADLIVAERHAGRHLAAGLLRLTDWELLRLSPVPLLLVKRPGLYRRPVVLAAVDPISATRSPSGSTARSCRRAPSLRARCAARCTWCTPTHRFPSPPTHAGRSRKIS